MFTPTAARSFTDVLLIRVQCGFFTQAIQVPLLGRGVEGDAPYTPIEVPSDIVSTAPTTGPA